MLTLWWNPILIHISQETGTSNASSRAYDFWSGFGSDIGEVTLLGGIIVGLRHINCHVTGCRRIRTHLVPGTPYRACRKHHPGVPTNGPITAERIADAHEAGKHDRGSF